MQILLFPPPSDYFLPELDGPDDNRPGDEHRVRGAGEGILRDPHRGNTQATGLVLQEASGEVFILAPIAVFWP